MPTSVARLPVVILAAALAACACGRPRALRHRRDERVWLSLQFVEAYDTRAGTLGAWVPRTVLPNMLADLNGAAVIPVPRYNGAGHVVEESCTWRAGPARLEA
jgi:ABC-type uncharacterized transport system permease subunit